MMSGFSVYTLLLVLYCLGRRYNNYTPYSVDSINQDHMMGLSLSLIRLILLRMILSNHMYTMKRSQSTASDDNNH